MESTGEQGQKIEALMEQLKCDLRDETEFRTIHPGGKHHFNNFFMKLPGGSSRRLEEMDLIGDISFGPEVRHGKTNREFFTEIDKIAIDKHVSIEEISKLQAQLAEIPIDDPLNIDCAARDKLELLITALALPIYAALLSEGYTDQDITS
jgi:hypothetical protein